MFLALGTFCVFLSSSLAAAEEQLAPPSAAALAADDECSAGGGSGCSLEVLQLRGEKVTLEESQTAWEGLDDAHSWKAYLASLPLSSGLLQEGSTANKHQECHMKDSKCPISGMGDKPTLVYPAGLTRCFNGDPYAFAVTPGDKDKLLFYFEGGGACWEAKGNVVLQCTDSISYGIQTLGLGTGIQDRSNENNPFRSYTVVEPIYCAGDAFMGTKTQQWKGKTYYQHGYHNALAAVNWVKENIAGELSSLVISGFSAGSLGTMAWSTTLLQTLKYTKATVLLDSYAGVFPDGTEGPALLEWGACKTGLWSPKVQANCDAGTMLIEEPYMEAMTKFPNVAFASIQSKVDGTQIWFYKGMAMSNFMMGPDGATLSDSGFYAKSLKIYEEFNTYPNFVEILVDGSQHCYTQDASFFTATTAGKAGGEGQALHKWVGELIDGKVASACSGLIEGPEASSGSAYCDQKLLPKVLVVTK